MEGEDGIPKQSKRFSEKGGEVDFNLKPGTAWSHNFLNQKPWHPLSYPNQRRKWIAEQTHVQRERRADEVAREFAQEQEFFRQTALVSQKEKEKMEIMKAVSFMYVRPPGYNAESAKAAELSEEKRKEDELKQQQDGPSSSMPPPSDRDQSRDDKKKSRPKDVFGRALPTEEQFEVLKNAPRLETGAPARPKPFAVEIRNVKCLRCGTFGHQSGDRECPMKDAIMPNEESRLQRDDPLTAMQAHAESNEPLKWELKQKPGMSPPRGGYDPDDPNQQIVAEDIFDEYGGFLGEESIPDLLATFTSSKPKKKSKSKKKHKRHSSPSSNKYRYNEDHDLFSGDHNNGKRRKYKSRRSKHSDLSSSDHDDKVVKKEAYEGEIIGSGLRSKKKNNKRRSSPSGNKYRYDEEHHSSSDDHDDRKGSKKKKYKSRISMHSDVSSSDHDVKVVKKETYDGEISGSRSKKKNDSNTKQGYFEPSSSDHEEKSEKKKAYDYDYHDRMESRSKKGEDCRTKHRYSEPNYPSGDGEFDKSLKRRKESPRSKKSRYREDDDYFDNDGKLRWTSRQHNTENSKHGKYSFPDEDKFRQNEACEDDRGRWRSRSKKRDDYETKHWSSRPHHSPGHDQYNKERKSSRHGHS